MREVGRQHQHCVEVDALQHLAQERECPVHAELAGGVIQAALVQVCQGSHGHVVQRGRRSRYLDAAVPHTYDLRLVPSWLFVHLQAVFGQG